MTLRSMVIAVFAMGCIAAPALRADDVYIYPAKNQSPEQQEKDKYECYQFGKSQTGFDPMAAPQATAPAPEKKGGLLKGAAGGALAAWYAH